MWSAFSLLRAYSSNNNFFVFFNLYSFLEFSLNTPIINSSPSTDGIPSTHGPICSYETIMPGFLVKQIIGLFFSLEVKGKFKYI